MKRNNIFAVILLAALVLALFADVLLVPGNKVAAYRRSDINTYFSASRSFGFGEISRGNLPLWNPHVFSGSPYVANFQSALFYPPNLIYLFLPLAKAFNVDLAFHVLLFGLLTFAWCRGRGQSALGGTLSASAAMFGSGFYLHVFAGHVTMLAGFAWAPLLFLAIDKVFEKPRAVWVMAGVLAVTMQILGGLPQVLLVTGVAAGLYVWFRLVDLAIRRKEAERPGAGPVFLALSVMAVAPLFLGAVQLWPGLQNAAASTRGGGVPLSFATTFSFPWENLMMLVAPHVFGGDRAVAYWGDWLYWEVSLYVGAVALMLALYGALRGRNWYVLPVAALLLAVALGRYAPVYKWLHGSLPGFGSFRGPARFLTPVSLFLAVLAGAGADRLVQARNTRGKLRGWFAVVPLVTGLCLAVLAVTLQHAFADPAWREVLVKAADRIGYGGAHLLRMTTPISRHRWMAASRELAIFGVLLSSLGVLWTMSGNFRPASYAIVVLAIGEVFMFGWRHRAEFDLVKETAPQLEQFEALNGEGGRIFHLWPSHPGLQEAGLYDVWGYDPVVDRRYAEFFAEAAGIKKPVLYAGISNTFLSHAGPGRLLRLLRLKALVFRNRRVARAYWNEEPLPRFFLVNRYEKGSTRQETFRIMKDPLFRLRDSVVLEAKPEPEPAPAHNGGKVEVVETGTDYAVVEVEVDAPAILVNTDAYAEGWRALNAGGGGQDEYKVMRADYALRAIPLEAGRHRVRLEYAPWAFTAGLWASVVSAGVLAAAGAVLLARRRRREVA